MGTPNIGTTALVVMLTGERTEPSDRNVDKVQPAYVETGDQPWILVELNDGSQWKIPKTSAAAKQVTNTKIDNAYSGTLSQPGQHN